MVKNDLIAFIGIDGSGKTSVIKYIKEELKKEGKECYSVYMGLGKDHYLPFLKKLMRIYGRIRYSKKGNSSGKKRDNFRTRSFAWLIVQYFEMLARYLSYKKKSGYIFFDRYFYDGLALANPLSFRILKRFIPRPDKTFLLYAEPELIRKRKKEANKKQIEDYYQKINKISEDFEIIKVDNSGPIKKVVKEILGYIKNEN